MRRLRSTASDLIAFIRAPSLDAGESKQDRKPADVAWLFLLNCLIVLAIAMVLFPLMTVFGVKMSSDMSALFKRPLWQIMLFVVVVGPIAEELMFRTWISGSPRLLAVFLAFIAWFGSSYLLAQPALAAFGSTATIAAIVLIAIGTLWGLVRFWKRPVPAWYRRAFPLVFWGQALLFGFVHLFNYAGDNSAAVLPFVLPQLAGGLIWGYARIRYGWWSNIVMHMAYNLMATSGLLYVQLAGTNGL